MAEPGPPASLPRLPAPFLHIQDLTALTDEQLRPVLAEMVAEAPDGPGSIERIVVFTSGRIPEEVPALTAGADREGLTADQIRLAHVGDYVPAPPSVCGPDAAMHGPAAPGPAAGPHGYELYRAPAAPPIESADSAEDSAGDQPRSLARKLDSPLVVILGTCGGAVLLLVAIVLFSILFM